MKGREGKSKPSGFGDVVSAGSNEDEVVPVEEDERSGEGREIRRGIFVAGSEGDDEGDDEEVGLEFS